MKHSAVLAGATVALALTASASMATDVKIEGTVTDVFGHRYVVDEGGKKSLVDIGPKGLDAVTIKSGDRVKIKGEATDAGEVRAQQVAVGDGQPIELHKSWWDKLTGKDDKSETAFTPEDAKAIVTKAGYVPVGEPRPEKKHFEVLAKKDGNFVEVHAHRNGDVKHERPVDASNPKWAGLVK